MFELHRVLAETLAVPGAREWILDRKVTANEVGLLLLDEARSFLDSLDDRALARYLIGGLAVHDLPESVVSLAIDRLRPSSYIMAPLPNMLYTRDTTTWVNDALTLNPLFWPARHGETLLMAAVYRFHPAFTPAASKIVWGDPEKDWGPATVEGGDVLAVGGGVVIIGMSERTSQQAITQVAAALFDAGAAEAVIVAGMPRLRAAMHLDTILTFADRDVVTVYRSIVDDIEQSLFSMTTTTPSWCVRAKIKASQNTPSSNAPSPSTLRSGRSRRSSARRSATSTCTFRSLRFTVRK